MNSVPSSLPARPARPAEAIAVTGSKGGVGKSNLVVNLAIALRRNGRRILVVDGDLGLANVDVLLGLVPNRTVEHLLTGHSCLEDVLLEGPEGIQILPAASGLPGLTRLERPARSRLLAALARSSYLVDELLIDTGAGLGDTTLALQLAASRVIVVTTNEPTSLVDAYASIKILWGADPKKRVDLVVNNIASDEEATGAYRQIARACGEFLGQEPGWLGPIYSDPQVQGAVRRQRALLDLYPTSPAARCYERIALRLSAQPPVGPRSTYWHRLAGAADGEVLH